MNEERTYVRHGDVRFFSAVYSGESTYRYTPVAPILDGRDQLE
jgi:hypothetical protein